MLNSTSAQAELELEALFFYNNISTPNWGKDLRVHLHDLKNIRNVISL
jgi:hypothetical protein